MAVNGVRGAGGHDICVRGGCACGHPPLQPAQYASPQARETDGAPALRLHAFWECPVAQAVLRVLSGALVSPGLPPVALHVAHLWLCLPPLPVLNATVWRLACLAAVSAMDYGRRVMWAVHFEAEALAAGPPVLGDERHLRQLTLLEAWGVEGPGPPLDDVPEPPAPVQRACRAAVADFWSRLQSYVSLHAADTSVLPGLSATHPFLARQDGRLVLHRPLPG